MHPRGLRHSLRRPRRLCSTALADRHLVQGSLGLRVADVAVADQAPSCFAVLWRVALVAGVVVLLAPLPLLLLLAEAEAVAALTVSSMDRCECRDADLAEARGRYCPRPSVLVVVPLQQLVVVAVVVGRHYYCPLPSVLVVVIVPLPLQQLVVVVVVVVVVVGRHYYYWTCCNRFACFRC